MTANEYKEYKDLKKESLRDNMTDIEIALADLGEISTRELAKERKPYGLDENKKVAKIGGEVVSNTRKDFEKKLGKPVIASNNKIPYEEYKPLEK